MLSCLLFVLPVTSLSPSHTESGKTSALKDICKTRCACEERQNILNINCENKGFATFSQFQAPPNKISQLILKGNLLSKISTNEFINYGNVTSLHLGGNGLQEIQPGAFNGLRFLKKLHLNNNNLEVIQEDTLAGLESLEYLQVDANYISTIEPGAFSKLTKLKVLILNDNLLSSLPPNIFRCVPLTHLDLRGNRLKMLPLAGVLEHMRSILAIQLQGNPWDCTCNLIPLKSWLDTTSLSVGDIVCETPSRLHGKDITQLLEQDLCPRRNTREPILLPSDSHFQGALHLTDHPTAITPTHAHQVYQTPSPVPMLCPSVCSCTSQNPDSGLIIDCRGRKLQNISELNPKPLYPKELYLTGNYLQVIYRLDLAEYSSLQVLHLGNNRITVIQEGAFENLTNLKRLYLNGNNIESLSQSLFAGLQSLKHLYLEYNMIKKIPPQTFSTLHNLRQLFLNNNLLHSLPDNVFRGTMLARLNLRSNHFSHLPVQGVLDQLPAFIQTDLQGNPWNCTCPILALKDWMELPSMGVNKITCNSPSQHAGRLLRSLRNKAICPKPSDELPPHHSPPTKTQTLKIPSSAATTPSSSSTSSFLVSLASPTESPFHTPEPYPEEPYPEEPYPEEPYTEEPYPEEPHPEEPHPEEPHPGEPPSMLTLSRGVIFILYVSFSVGIFMFILKRCRMTAHAPIGASNLDLTNPNPNSVQVQNGSDTPEPRQDTSSESHVCGYTPPSCSMCQNPVYMQKVGKQKAYHRNLQEFSFGPLDAKKEDVLTRSPRVCTTSTMAFIEKCPPSFGLTPPASPETLYETLGERPNQELPRAAGAPPAPLLPRKLKAEPYHREVLKNQTVMTQV